MSFLATVRRKSGESRNELDRPWELEADSLGDKRCRILRTLAAAPHTLLENEVTVSQVMSTHPIAVSPDARFSDIKKKMARQRLRHLLVSDSDGRLIGLISDRDVLRRNGIFAKQVMSRDPISVAPNAKLVDAISLILEKRISCIPVVEDGRPIGILTTTDLLMTLQCVLAMAPRLQQRRSQCGVAESETPQPTPV